MKSETAAGLLIGIGIGIIVGSLIAPDSGERTRYKLNKKLKKGVRELTENAGEFIDSAAEALDRGRTELARHRYGVTDAISKGKEAFQKVVG